MPDPNETIVSLRFPVRGIETSTGYIKQPQGTTPSAVNVRSYDAGTERLRGGSRAGLTPFFGAGSTIQVNGTNKVQSLNCVITTMGVAVVGLTASPGQAYLSGRQYTVLTGSGFTGATSVKFGTQDAEWFDVINDTTINCLMFCVDHAQTVTVTVTTPSGTVTGPFVFLFAAIDGTFVITPTTGASAQLGIGCLASDQKVHAYSNPDPLPGITSALALSYDALSGSAKTVCQCAGPDGNIWSVDVISLIGSTAKKVWKTVPGGASTAYTLEASTNKKYWGIIPGPKDGNLYVFGSDHSGVDAYIYKVTTAGTVTAFSVYSGQSMTSVCMGPDLRVWGIGGTDGATITAADLTQNPPVLTSYPRPGRSFDTTYVVVGNDLRIWTDDGSLNYYVFSVTDPTNGAYYTTALTLESFLPSVAGPDGTVWQICTALSGNPNSTKLVSNALLTGAQTPIGPLNLTATGIVGYHGLTAGDDGALYTCGSGNTAGNFVQFT